MIVTAVNGSPKGEKSNTAVMLCALLEGFGENGDTLKKINLSEYDIAYCKGCYSCWFENPGVCIQKDDMAELINEIDGSDIIILGTPLYFNNISGTMKVFIDRLTAAGGDPHKKEIKTKTNPEYIIVSNCGFPVVQQFEVISLWMKHFCQLLQANLLAEFYTTNGKVLTMGTEDQKKSRENYLHYLRECGCEISKNRYLNDGLRNQTRKSIIEF